MASSTSEALAIADLLMSGAEQTHVRGRGPPPGLGLSGTLPDLDGLTPRASAMHTLSQGKVLTATELSQLYELAHVQSADELPPTTGPLSGHPTSTYQHHQRAAAEHAARRSPYDTTPVPIQQRHSPYCEHPAPMAAERASNYCTAAAGHGGGLHLAMQSSSYAQGASADLTAAQARRGTFGTEDGPSVLVAHGASNKIANALGGATHSSLGWTAGSHASSPSLGPPHMGGCASTDTCAATFLTQTSRQPKAPASSSRALSSLSLDPFATATSIAFHTNLVKFGESERDRDVIISAIRDSARVRAECTHASEVVGRDFHRDFSPADHPFRRPARSLVIKSNNVAARLQAQLKTLEDTTWGGLAASNLVAMERAAVITLLAREVQHADSSLDSQVEAMRVANLQVQKRLEAEFAVKGDLLIETLHDSEEELEGRDRTIKELSMELKETRAKLANEEAENKSLAETCTQMKREMDRIQKEAEAFEKKYAALERLYQKEGSAHKKTAQDAKVEHEKLNTEIARQYDFIKELEGTSGNAAKRLRSAELEGGNLRALATAACDKLDKLEKVAAALQRDLDRANFMIAERDEAVLEMERRIANLLNEKREVDALRTIVMELQQVLKEALKAGSWKTCRQILYHESLRYVPTAATHGKSGPGGSHRPEEGLGHSGLIGGGGGRGSVAALGKRESGKNMDGGTINRLLDTYKPRSASGAGLEPPDLQPGALTPTLSMFGSNANDSVRGPGSGPASPEVGGSFHP